jgi:hypothetical protein
MDKLRILCRRFEPFEKLTEGFVEGFKAYYPGFDAEIISLPLPELHASIMRGDFDIAHVNTDWVTQGWEAGVLEDLRPYIDEEPPEDYTDGWDSALLKLQTFGEGRRGAALPRWAGVSYIQERPVRVGGQQGGIQGEIRKRAAPASDMGRVQRCGGLFQQAG